ncbi:sec31 [Symbiodinium sp. CCMP2592]|nr:sec31 [Symbiodinium sp. CCMP2592]
MVMALHLPVKLEGWHGWHGSHAWSELACKVSFHAAPAAAAAEAEEAELVHQQEQLYREGDKEILEDIAADEGQAEGPLQEMPEAMPPPPPPEEPPQAAFEDLASALKEEAPRAGLVISLPAGSGVPSSASRAAATERLTGLLGKLQDAADVLGASKGSSCGAALAFAGPPRLPPSKTRAATFL